MQNLRKEAAAQFLGVDNSTVDRYVRDNLLHPIYPFKRSEPYFAEWELRRLLMGTSRASAVQQNSSGNVRRQYSSLVWDLLTCPHCHKALCQTEHGACCSACLAEFGYSEYGSLDLRPKRRLTSQVEFHIEPPSVTQTDRSLSPGKEDVGGIDRQPNRTLREWYTRYWPKKVTEPSIGLELGTANILQQETFEASGFEYLGVDYDAVHALMLVDAHALPFRDNSIPFIVAYAFLEHLQFPALAMREVYRVLKPGGTFIGTVSFLEPFHLNSFYHHTHLGVMSTLKAAGFNDITVVASKEWRGLVAQAQMALFPGIVPWLAKCLIAPVELVHRLWWQMLHRFYPRFNEDTRVRNTTGAFDFFARKPGS